ncbi:right-handed parallel beta-helix repeat-containing protein [Asaia sp. BMEF1]|uniref:right-handed parallel beta-helix repeat-containing protein n=1 Tax=Asaia sp. BMEF1 TaxID=3155932 RepID=UPI003F678E33
MKMVLLTAALFMLPFHAFAQPIPNLNMGETTRVRNDVVQLVGTNDRMVPIMKTKPDTDGGAPDSASRAQESETHMLTERHQSVEAATPSTIWVGGNYLSHVTFISKDTTWTVCAYRCDYRNALDAWHAAINANFLNGARLTIRIADGVYNLNNQFFTNVTKTQYVRVIGNTTNPGKVILNFIKTKGTNFNGFSAYGGGKIGLIDGITIQSPADGTGALLSTDHLGRHTWNAQSYGSGIIAFGAGSNITVGNHVVIRNFYYSMTADNNGGIDASQGGVSMALAGDVNAMARGGGVIVCTPCMATDASDYTNKNIQLGSNYDAERGGSLYIDGSIGSGSLISSITGLTGGHIWAHNIIISKSLIFSSGQGVWITGNSSAELIGCDVSGYNIGINVTNGGYADLDLCNIHDNGQSGVIADGGRLTGNSVSITDNKVYGIQAIHQGTVIMFHTYAKMHGNGTNFSAQPAGVESTSRSPYTASSMDIQ